MLTFKALTIDDKQILDKYLKHYTFTTSEYSFTNLLIWRKGCDIQYSIYKDILVIKKKDFKENYHFMQPIGYTKENLKELIEKLETYKKEHNMDYLFKDVENSFLEDLKDIYGETAHIEEDIDNFDYIYSKDKLISLSGKKLHSKKNHYNFFIKNYKYTVKDFSEDGVKSDSVELARVWYNENDTGSKYLKYELDGLLEIVNHSDELNLQGMAVYVDGEIASFTIGERVNDNMAIIYFEKARKDIHGIYAFTNRTFVEKYLSDVTYINREQDLGIEGLRKAKKSYQPIKLEEKYCVNL